MITSMQNTATAPRSFSPARGTIRVAYTPDSDDAFNYYAWEHGRVTLEGFRAGFERGHIRALNAAAEQGAYDVVGVSSAVAPFLGDRYWILSVGNSVGRGYGPVLVSKHYERIEELRSRRIAVAGRCTTGGALAMMYCPGARFVELPYDQIADAVVAEEFDAGVMIHEELLYFPQKGLRRVCDLGALWSQDTGLPLPVGLNLVKKDLGRPVARAIADTCERSLRWALEHFDEAFAYANRFGRGCAGDHIALFSNEDTLCLPADAREAISVMFHRIAILGLGPAVEPMEIIDA